MYQNECMGWWGVQRWLEAGKTVQEHLVAPPSPRAHRGAAKPVATKWESD